MDFSICGILGQFYGANQTRYQKRFSALLKGVKIKCFPLKLAFKNVIVILFPNLQFVPNFQKVILALPEPSI